MPEIRKNPELCPKCGKKMRLIVTGYVFVIGSIDSWYLCDTCKIRIYAIPNVHDYVEYKGD